jgi:hypothetical protein
MQTKVSTKILADVAEHFVGEPVKVQLGDLPYGRDGEASYPDIGGRVINLAHGLEGETLMHVLAHEIGHHVLDHPGKPSNRHLVMWTGAYDEMIDAARQANPVAVKAMNRYQENDLEAERWAEENAGRVKQQLDICIIIDNAVSTAMENYHGK